MLMVFISLDESLSLFMDVNMILFYMTELTMKWRQEHTCFAVFIDMWYLFFKTGLKFRLALI